MLKRLLAIPVVVGLLFVVACGKPFEERFAEVYCNKGHECRAQFESRPFGKVLFVGLFQNSVDECKAKFTERKSKSDGGSGDGGTVTIKCVIDEAKGQKCLDALANTKCEDLTKTVNESCKDLCKK